MPRRKVQRVGEATAFHRVARRKFESSVTRARRNGCQVARTCSAYYLVQVAATRAGKRNFHVHRPSLHAPPEFHPNSDVSSQWFSQSMDFYNRILRK